jgi:hypothetical protein
MEDKERGLYDKYKVERLDGKPIEKGCIVLEWSDRLARAGIKAFAAAVTSAGYLRLGNDLKTKLRDYGDPWGDGPGVVVISKAMSPDGDLQLDFELRDGHSNPLAHLTMSKTEAKQLISQLQSSVASIWR